MSDMPCIERIQWVMQRVYDRRKRFEYAKQVAESLSDGQQIDLACHLLGLTFEQLTELVTTAVGRETA